MSKRQKIIQEFLKDPSRTYRQIFEALKSEIDTTYNYVKRILTEYKKKANFTPENQQLEKPKNTFQGDNTKNSVNIIKRKKRELFLSDIHIPYHDEKALSAALNYALDEKITDIVLAGDVADFKSVSFWERDANERDLNYEVEIIKNILNEIREAFPGAKIRYIEGNHEEFYLNYMG